MERNKIAYRSDSRWKNYYKELKIRIETDSRDFPSKEEIDRLVSLADRAFGDSQFHQYYIDKNIELRDLWMNHVNARERKKREKEQEKSIKEPEIVIVASDEKYSSIFSILNKIASDSHIETAEDVSIQLTKEGALIFFSNKQETCNPITSI